MIVAGAGRRRNNMARRNVLDAERHWETTSMEPGQSAAAAGAVPFAGRATVALV